MPEPFVVALAAAERMTLWAVLRDLVLALRDEFRALSFRNPRVLLAMRPVLSVGIAVAAAHAFGLRDSWWAAISAFVVIQASLGESLYRGALRIVGTVGGAAAGLALGPPVFGHPVAFVLLMSGAAWLGLFAALVLRHSYAFVLALVTFVMVACAALGSREGLTGFAVERVANIVVGTLACVLVAALTERRFVEWMLRRQRLVISAAAPPAASAAGPVVDRHRAALHALQAAVAVAVLAVVLCFHPLQGFSQAMVTTLAVMVVPLGGGVVAARSSVMQRMAQRFAGCLSAGVIAFALLPLIGERPGWCQAALALGVWAGAYLQGGTERVRYLALQFSVAFMMVFVQDRGWTVEEGAALQRLAGVLAGIATLSAVIHLFGKSTARRHTR